MSCSDSATERARKQLWHGDTSSFKLYGDLASMFSKINIKKPATSKSVSY